MGVIYSITNKINGACYIGSTVTNGSPRWIRHKTDLNANIHHSQYLQRAYNKYGKDNFEYVILETVDEDNLLAKEQEYLDDRKNNYPSDLNYNMCWVAGNCSGRKFSDDTKLKMSKNSKNRIVSKETRDKIGKALSDRANKIYCLISPENEVHNFTNIRKFCRENGLECTSIGLLLQGKIHYNKGWVANFSHTYAFTDPNGVVFENIVSLTKFCEEHKLRMKGMSKLHRGYNKTYYGWTKYGN